MGLVIALQDEKGRQLETIEDPHNFLHRILPKESESSFPNLPNIDWYGHTVFNRLQAYSVVEEFRTISARASGSEEAELIATIIRMGERCRDEVHLYLKFIGD